MNNRSNTHWGLGLMVMILLIISSSVGWSMNGVGSEELISPISYSDIILHPDEMAEDLEFIIQTLEEVHPFFEHKANRQFYAELATIAKEKIKEPMSRQKFYLIASQLVNFLDGQTHLWFQQEDRHLPLQLQWVSDGIMVIEVHDSSLPITIGDELASIGGMQADDLFSQLRNMLPSDNDYRIYALGGSLLTVGYVLDTLGVVSETGQVEMNFCKSSGEEYTVQVPWQLVGGKESTISQPAQSIQPWYDWYIREDLGYGVFRLDACKDGEEFQAELEEFFIAVKKAGIQNIALDLRNNSGGDLGVIDSILSYFPAQIIRYPVTEIRYSRQAQEQIGYSRLNHFVKSMFRFVWDEERAISRPKDHVVIYEGNFFVLTSNQTFAEATLMATIFRDNGLAKIIGEPTGSSPTYYGGALEFYTPNLNFYMTVSYKSFFRPDQEQIPTDTLMPDYLVPMRLEDLRLARDPQLEWIEGYCQEVKE